MEQGKPELQDASSPGVQRKIMLREKGREAKPQRKREQKIDGTLTLFEPLDSSEQPSFKFPNTGANI